MLQDRPGGTGAIGFLRAHGDALEVLEFAEEVFDEAAGFGEVLVDLRRRAALWLLRDRDPGGPTL
jgi:hypothetical protein